MRKQETEIERLKEELRRKKDRENLACGQINQKLKQKTNNFEKLHRDHKQLYAEHKKLVAELDRQQETMRKLHVDVAKRTDTLAEDRTKTVESAKLLEEAAKDRMKLTW